MAKVYIINTNKRNNPHDEISMLEEHKCAAYFTPWKYYIDTIEPNDIVFLYSNQKGIIARGVATGIVEIKDYNNQLNEERYMHLNQFEILNKALPAGVVTEIIRRVAGPDFEIKWNQTMVPLSFNFGIKVWQHITKSCFD